MTGWVYGFGAAMAFASLVPLVRRDEWWIRVFDFPRLQIAALDLLALAALVAGPGLGEPAGLAIAGGLIAGLANQARRIAPYTRLAPKEVRGATVAGPASRISVLVANVLMSNREADRLLAIARECQPDLLLALEPDAWWEERLGSLDYAHVVSHPRDDRYGISLRSRLPLVEPEVTFLVNEQIPSVHARVRLRDGRLISFHGLHPEPPAPTEAPDAAERDAELLIVGRAVRDETLPVIVTGDLNDVAWSHTTNLFRKASGLLDPRRGRGMYNTFHAQIPLLRFPLDHIFHSKHFLLLALERLPAFGSDHFPMYCELALDGLAPALHDEPTPEPEERVEVRRKIEKVVRRDATESS